MPTSSVQSQSSPNPHPTLPPFYTALFALGMGGAAGTYRYQTDEGTRRSVYFWSRAFPIYLHYRYVREEEEGGREGGWLAGRKDGVRETLELEQ